MGLVRCDSGRMRRPRLGLARRHTRPGVMATDTSPLRSDHADLGYYPRKVNMEEPSRNASPHTHALLPGSARG